VINGGVTERVRLSRRGLGRAGASSADALRRKSSWASSSPLLWSTMGPVPAISRMSSIPAIASCLVAKNVETDTRDHRAL
jgi:hypothetical protein